MPFPIGVPPQVPTYHCHVAEVPSMPPLSEIAIEVPGQTVNEGVPFTNVGVKKAY